MQKWMAVCVMVVMALVPALAVAQSSINTGNGSPANNNTLNSASGGSVTGPSNSVSGSGLQIGVNQQGQSNAVGQGGQGGTAYGGNGGRGGRGGNANQDQQQGIFHSGNSSNRNTNRNQNDNTNVNLNRNSNQQSQGQGQLQGQRQGQGQGQSQGSTTSGNVQGGNTQGGTDVSIETDVPRQAPPAFAPNLVAAPETCMGSSAVGVSSPFGGVSVGTTYKSDDCELRMFARSLMSLGQPDAALALLAQNEKVAAALRKVGHKAAWLQQEKDRTPVPLVQGITGGTVPLVTTTQGP